MHDEQYYPPQLDFNLNSYRRDEAGLVADIEDARTIIRNLQQIIRFLEVAPFDQLPLNTQAEISLYLVGTHLLTQRPQDSQHAEKAAILESLFNAELAETIQREKTALNTEDILHSVERPFQDFGK